jgi:hypothetical protein
VGEEIRGGNPLRSTLELKPRGMIVEIVNIAREVFAQSSVFTPRYNSPELFELVLVTRYLFCTHPHSMSAYKPAQK